MTMVVLVDVRTFSLRSLLAALRSCSSRIKEFPSARSAHPSPTPDAQGPAAWAIVGTANVAHALVMNERLSTESVKPETEHINAPRNKRPAVMNGVRNNAVMLLPSDWMRCDEMK